MKTSAHCPNCQGKNISRTNKTTQVLFGIAMTIVGLGFLVYAVTTAVGYYLFALPLCTVGAIRTYKGYTYAHDHAHCMDCKTDFECYLSHE